MICIRNCVYLAAIFLFLPLATRASEEFKLVDGDRVVFLGSTVIEREQRYGYWETMLTSRLPEKNITFRNLGWSGDTVFGDARAGFDTPKEGYKRLVTQTFSVKPTVIFICYGTNESFAGDPGLERFRTQYHKLLDDLTPSNARFVLMAPPMFEEARWPGGDFEKHQRDLKRYTQAIQEIAHKRGAFFVNEFCQRRNVTHPMTDNGMHLTEIGYWFSALNLRIELQCANVIEAVELEGLQPKQVTLKQLPGAPVPTGSPKDRWQSDCSIRARGLKPGMYTLHIDGKPVLTADAEAWTVPGANFRFGPGPSLEQSEKLRLKIVEKNQAYFHRWRPQNETYLFGFRKYEQGQNAKEMPQFDPIVAKLEQEIAKLRVPVPHTYQLVPQTGEKP